jgi:hypothetical protein
MLYGFGEADLKKDWRCEEEEEDLDVLGIIAMGVICEASSMYSPIRVLRGGSEGLEM